MEELMEFIRAVMDDDHEKAERIAKKFNVQGTKDYDQSLASATELFDNLIQSSPELFMEMIAIATEGLAEGQRKLAWLGETGIKDKIMRREAYLAMATQIGLYTLMEAIKRKQMTEKL